MSPSSIAQPPTASTASSSTTGLQRQQARSAALPETLPTTDVLETPAPKNCRPSVAAFAKTQRDLEAFARDTAEQWLLPHRRYIAWPHRVRSIARHLMQAGNGLGISTFPDGFENSLIFPMLDNSPGHARYALALSMWQRGLIAVSESLSGFGPADADVILSAVANNTAQALQQYGPAMKPRDRQTLQQGIEELRLQAGANRGLQAWCEH